MDHAEIPHVSIRKEEIEGNEDKNGDGEDPLDPWKLDIEIRTLRKVDTEEHQAKWHGGLGRNIPEEKNWQEERVRNEGGVDKKRIKVAKNAKDEPRVRIARTREDHPQPDEKAQKRQNGECKACRYRKRGELLSVDRGEADCGGLDGPCWAAAVGDGEQIAWSRVANLIECDLATGIGLAVDGDDGVGRLKASGTGFFAIASVIVLRIATVERQPSESIAMRKEVVVEHRTAVRMQQRKRGHYSEKKILEACGSLIHRLVGEMVAALSDIGTSKLFK